MKLLPFHVRRISTLRPAILYRILLIPFVTALAAIAWLAPERPQPPFDHRIDYLSSVLAIPPERLAESINAPLVLGIFVLGYSLGWLLNFVALVIIRRSSLSAIAQMIAGGNMPSEWELVGAREKLVASKQKDKDEWMDLQKLGIFRYIAVQGGVIFGSVCFVGINIILPLVTLRPIAVSSLPVWLFIWVLLGVAITAFTWASLKFSQRGEA